jgi:aminoglycoside phosphotransferase (APT) family kinase protein
VTVPDDVEVLIAHHERVTMRVRDWFLKVDVEDWRIEREAEAIGLASAAVPVPTVLWRQPNTVALTPVPGRQLAGLGSPSTASAAAWKAAGAAARALHRLPPPAWKTWGPAEFADFLDGECRWLVDHGIAEADVIETLRKRVEPALRPWTNVFTHGDLQSAHVFVDGDRVTGIIDWSDAVAGDPLFDLAILTVGHAEWLDDVERGYGEDLDRDVVRGWWSLRKVANTRWMLEHGFDASGDMAELHRFAAT